VRNTYFYKSANRTPDTSSRLPLCLTGRVGGQGGWPGRLTRWVGSKQIRGGRRGKVLCFSGCAVDQVRSYFLPDLRCGPCAPFEGTVAVP
jgi:hypothetical protein